MSWILGAVKYLYCVEGGWRDFHFLTTVSAAELSRRPAYSFIRMIPEVFTSGVMQTVIDNSM